jgi:hypothetical protein
MAKFVFLLLLTFGFFYQKLMSSRSLSLTSFGKYLFTNSLYFVATPPRSKKTSGTVARKTPQTTSSSPVDLTGQKTAAVGGVYCEVFL